MGLFSLAIVFVETWSAVKFRRQKAEVFVGGPAYYLQDVFPDRLGQFLSKFYGISLLGAGFGIGSMVQSNSVASVGLHGFQIPPLEDLSPPAPAKRSRVTRLLRACAVAATRGGEATAP